MRNYVVYWEKGGKMLMMMILFKGEEHDVEALRYALSYSGQLEYQWNLIPLIRYFLNARLIDDDTAKRWTRNCLDARPDYVHPVIDDVNQIGYRVRYNDTYGEMIDFVAQHFNLSLETQRIQRPENLYRMDIKKKSLG